MFLSLLNLSFLSIINQVLFPLLQPRADLLDLQETQRVVKAGCVWSRTLFEWLQRRLKSEVFIHVEMEDETHKGRHKTFRAQRSADGHWDTGSIVHRWNWALMNFNCKKTADS